MILLILNEWIQLNEKNEKKSIKLEEGRGKLKETNRVNYLFIHVTKKWLVI